MILSVREELDKRGADLDKVLCSCCYSMVESCQHSLVRCSMAMGVLEKIHYWHFAACLIRCEGKLRIPDWMLRLTNDRGNMSATRLTPDETEAQSNWWISSRAYFEGGIGRAERVPHHLNRQNMYEVPSEFYRQFEEQKRDLENQKRDIEEIRKKKLIIKKRMKKCGGPLSFQKHLNNSSFFNIGTLTNWQTLMPSQPGSSNWQRQMPTHLATPFWQPAIPSHPGTYNWQSPIPSHMGNLILQPPIGRHHDVTGLFDQSPYMEQPPSTILPKKRGNKTKNNVKKSNLSSLNLGNALDDENEGGDDVMFLGAKFTVPHLCMPNIDSNNPVGWLSGEHMNSWMEQLISNRPKNACGQWPIRIQ
uniref:Reverse transcriptase domain, reverse transcriptase zinc-binding domain protein n=1 Tax=Tanacetum cinerariifolium TaxID=118510 RepID=A0A6L2JHW8_TANCI|nr:reverse transcriptase domain, reverse transcriptase zinc-binding domain protein [Tanacetum cinerariifolium]